MHVVVLYHSWYQDAKAADGVIFTAPYTDASNNKLIMTAAVALFFDAEKGTSESRRFGRIRSDEQNGTWPITFVDCHAMRGLW